ncbi:MAG TPA: TonB-dependent receptor [Nitrospirota bacterium]|nr:TonB-dependent receptor [Nitrospirota bacterium]
MKGIVISVILVCAAIVLAIPEVKAEEESVQLKEVVVTATRTEKEPQELTQSVTVITADDIQKSGATTAAEVIARTAGADVKDYGSKGSLSSINLRGANAEQVLVLLDGRRLNSASAGGFDMADLAVPLEQIDRIEIVRGPSSALYGADAVGGVVNIITKEPNRAATTAIGEAGSHGFGSLTLSNSNKLDKFYYTLSAGKEKYDGFRANSDLDQWTAGAKLGYGLSPDSNLEFTTDYLAKEIGVPGSLDFPSPLARQWDRNIGYSLTYRTKFSKELDLRLNAFQNRERITFSDPDPVFPINSKHTSTSTGAEAQTNWLANSWNQLTFGLVARQDHVDSTDAGEHTASLWAAYLQDEISLGESLIVVIGARNDSHSVYGDKLSPKVSARYLFTGTGTIIRASAGQAFRAPTLNELFWTFDGFEQGNPNLKPETATEYEAGIEQPFGKGNSVKFTYFERKIDNLIQWLPDSNFIYSPINIGKAKITGSETEVKLVPWEPLTWAVNYTYMKAVDENTGLYVYNIPAEQLKSYVNLTLPTRTNIYIEGRYVRNYSQPVLPNPTQHYTVVDAKILQPVKLGEKMKCDVFFGVKNMFNRQYQVLAGYPAAPEELYGGVSVQF